MKKSTGILMALGALLTGGAIGYAVARSVSRPRKHVFSPCGCEDTCCCNDYDYEEDCWDEEDDEALYGGIEEEAVLTDDDDISF